MSEQQDVTAQPAPTSTKAYYRVNFTGQASEYFKIWIVNIALTIITLGIYSAWAKVRTRQYFYNNTLINNTSFQYHGEPLAILKGRIIAVILFVLYSFAVNSLPIIALPTFLIFMAALPWIVMRALAFNARMTSFKGIRFKFKANYLETLQIVLLWPILLIFTFGLIFPLIKHKYYEFVAKHTQFGNSGFAYQGKISDMFIIYLIAMAISAGVTTAMVIIGLIFAGFAGLASGMEDSSALMIWFASSGVTLFIVLYIALNLVIWAFVQAKTVNLIFNNLTLGENRFYADLNFSQVAIIQFTNTLAILFSLGLAYPWAAIRMTRYRNTCIQVIAADNLDNFTASEAERVNALGDEAAEVFDLDLAF
ncbi:YjgN family protein [Motilimonas sp. KMU-193]|uniref:YjgN family protein n=1 Tax=Motilimonas sp. KMU-193 TaxID=3388668 RepID=UPI00396B0FE4